MNRRKDQVDEAFKKLLSFVYYDKSGTMLHLRERIATRIAEDGKDAIITNVYDIINGSVKIENYLDKIDTKIVPKGVETTHENGNVLTNNRKEEKNDITGINLMFDGPVELFVLSVYWLMRHGYKLDKKLGDHCYGNRLWTEGEEEEIKSGKALLKPYINQYQTWRDKAINASKTHLEDGTDIGFVNLDITKFYYNVRLDWDKIEKELDIDKRDPVHRAIYSIYKKYSQNLEKNYGEVFKIKKGAFSNENSITLLPIGLPSSYVLANYHLLEFDQLVKEKIKPIYYGRYVDDILLVIKEPDLKSKPVQVIVTEKQNANLLRKPAKLSNLPKSVQFVANNLSDLLEIEYTRDIESHEYIDKNLQNFRFNFKKESLNQLFIQNEKVMIYEFKPEYSLSVIDKLKHDLEERSSEFRFLPTIEDTDFDKSAFHLLFDDSFGKPRTLKDYKENRFGIASYLFKRTAVALWSSKSEVSDEAKKILSFFKGSNIIQFYQQWERLFTYFVVANRKNELNDLIGEIFNEIDKVYFSDYPEKINRNLKQNLSDILCTSLSQALALDPSFLRNEWARTRLKNSYKRSKFIIYPFGLLSKIESLTVAIRKSYLLRHFYLQHSLIEYSPFSSSEDINSLQPLIGEPFNFDSTSTVDYKLSDDLIKKIDFPRFIKFYEICIYLWRLRILEAKVKFDNNGVNKTNLFEANDFLSEAWKIYSLINFDSINAGKDSKGRNRKDVFFKTHCKKIRTLEKSSDSDFDSHIQEIHVNNGDGNDHKNDICLALANIKVDWDKEAIQALKNRPNNISIERQQKFAALVNKLSEEEKFSPDLFILPEISVPHELVTYLSYYSVKHQVAMLLGTEHVRAGGLGINFIHSILPVELNEEMYDAIFLPRLKNHYSHEEVTEINGHQLEPLLPENFHYHLIKFRNSYYTTFYCFELSDIEHRSWFRSKIDFLAAPEFNHDVNYFSNIVESSARDLNTFVVQVNTSDYGDTRLTQPTKTEQKDLVRIKGGENDVVIIGKIKIDEFRKFQELGYQLQTKTKIYKPSPPNFNVSYVHKRINGDWIFVDECEDLDDSNVSR